MPGDTPANGGAAQDLSGGWALLREHRWARARAFFATAVEEEPEAEAFEGLSWAAWWMDDAEGVFDARGRAYRLYRERLDAVGAGRTAVWLATDALDFNGAPAVAAGWLARAHRHLDDADACPEHGWLAFNDGFLALQGGDAGTAQRLGRETAEIGRRFGVPDLEMLGLGLEGATLVALARVPEGMRCLDEATATALAGEARHPISGAWTFCFMVGACTAVLDYGRAHQWCDRIAEFAERHGSRYMLAFCRGDYGTVRLWRGQWDVAEAMLEASIEDYSRSRPALAGGSLATLAELRRRQGRRGEAAALVEQAAGFPRAELCRAQLALDDGEPARAAELLERRLRDLPADHRLERAPVLEVLVRAHLALGDPAAAGAAVEELRAAARSGGTATLVAVADLAEGSTLAAGGDHERAASLLEDAVDGFRRSGGPFETALARIELTASQVARGRLTAAREQIAVAVDELRAIGAEPACERARALQASIDDSAASPLSELTARERELLALLARGMTNRDIAARLVLSEHTVHRHVSNILRKLGLPSRAAAAAHAARSGLLERSGP